MPGRESDGAAAVSAQSRQLEQQNLSETSHQSRAAIQPTNNSRT
jgi:hypothetical protein